MLIQEKTIYDDSNLKEWLLRNKLRCYIFKKRKELKNASKISGTYASQRTSEGI